MDKVKIETVFDLLRHKESRGFELLYEQYYATLYGVAFSVLGSEEQSRDAVQNVMLRLYRLEADKFPSGHEMTWLYRVTKNEALMLLRGEKSSVPLEQVQELPVEEKRIEDFADMDYYRSVICGLNEKQKRIVTMKVLGGMTHREIAEVLALPIGTVQWIYNTSIRQLRRAMVALSLLVVLCGGALLSEVYRRAAQSPGPGQMGIATVPPEPSPWLGIWAVLLIAAAVAWVLFFKYSDRLPTKQKKPRI